MGSILINVPDIEDGELLFNEAETKQILKFFWPEQSASIDQMSVTNDSRRLAQTALIAGVDGTYAMSFIAGLTETVANPGSSLQSLIRKLGQNFAQKWWQHTKPKDLQNAKIYESVRRHLSRELRRKLDLSTQGANLGSKGVMFSYTTLCRSYKA
ncbi:MAG: hypothetical protein HEQ39_03280 [Rhizobacter sp.]